MTDQTITFNFNGQGSQLVSETKKIVQELLGLERSPKKVGEAFAALSNEIKKFGESSASSVDDVIDDFERLKTAILESQAAGKINAGSAQELIYKAEAEALNKRIALARSKVAELKRINEQSSSPESLAAQRTAENDLIQLRQRAAKLAIANNKEAVASNKQQGVSIAELAGKYYLVLQALQAVQGVGRAVYGTLIAQNVELQQQLLSTRASLVGTNKILQDGVEIKDPTAAITALEGPVNEAIARIRKGSLDLVGVTSRDLIPIFQTIAGQSGAIGADLEQSADLALDFAAALGTMGIPLAQQRQEVTSILQGTIDQNSILAQTLTINNDMVRQWKAQGTLLQELTTRLAPYRAGNKLAAQEIAGVTSNIKELFENITLEAGADLTATIAADLQDLYKLLVDNKEEILAFVQAGVDFFEDLYQQAKKAGSEILEVTEPLRESLADAFDEETLAAVELVFGGISKALVAIADQVSNDLALQGLLKIIDYGGKAVGAIANLGGAYSDSVEAAEIYRQQTVAVAETALEAQRKTFKGEADAAKARKEAIAQINDQIKNLREASLTGVENRDVVRSQIKELETWKSKLEASGSAIQLQSKSTQQLTIDLKLLNEEYEANAAKIGLAQAKLKEALTRGQLADPTTARAAQRQQLAIDREGFEEREKLIKEKIAGIDAIASQGGDIEQQKEFNKQRVAAETELVNLEISLAQNRIEARKSLEADALRDYEKRLSIANDDVAQVEAERLAKSQQALNDGLVTARFVEREKLAITDARIRREIALEEEKLDELKRLRFADPDEQEANEAKIRASRQRTAQLTLQYLQTQRSQERAYIEEVQKLITDRGQEEENQSAARLQQLEKELKAQDLINAAVERKTRLLEAEQSLQSAQANALAIGGQIEVDNLTRALEIRKRLNEENLDPDVQKALEKQLKLLTGKKDTSEAKILAERVVRENELQGIKEQTLLLEQQAARANLEIELERNRLAAERLVIETQTARLAAEQALAQAKTQQESLEADPEADPQQRRNAAAAVARAQANVDLAAKTQGDAQKQVVQQDNLARVARQTLTIQQQSAIAQSEAADEARRQANELAIAEANAEKLVKQLERSKSTFGQTFGDYAGRLGQQVTPAFDLQLGQIGGIKPLSPSGQVPQSLELRELVQVNKEQLTAAREMGAEIHRLLERPQVVNNVDQKVSMSDFSLNDSGI